MWNKRQDEPVRPAGASPAGIPPGAAPFAATPSFGAGPSTGPVDRRDAATVGASIAIVGDITGDEDLTILGRIEGKVDLPQHVVTVGQTGRVKADIHARVVSVAGEVRGNLVAGEQILIRKTATMLGNLTAPRVGLEDGCSFRGSVEMESLPERSRTAARGPVVAPVKPQAPPVLPPAPPPQAPSPGDGGPVKAETQPPHP
jgi:cytoskeletal protein CcmA (bactofilin family)